MQEHSQPLTLSERSLFLKTLLETFKTINADLTTISQNHSSTMIDPATKDAIATELELMNAIQRKTNNIFLDTAEDTIESQHDLIIAFAKLVLSALKDISRRFTLHSQSVFLQTQVIKIQTLIDSLSSILQRLAPSAKRTPVIDAAALEKEQAVYIKQQQVKKQKIEKVLEKIKSSAFSKGLVSKKIFISYAWPIENSSSENSFIQNSFNEAWTKQFVFDLATHLEDTGLDVLFDRKRSSCGSVKDDFMRNNIRTADHVLVICDRTLRFKLEEDSGSGVAYEYIETINRWRKERPDRFVIPLCLTEKEAFLPGFLSKFAALSTFEDDYLEVLKELISKIFGFDKSFNEWWEENIEPFNDCNYQPADTIYRSPMPGINSHAIPPPESSLKPPASLEAIPLSALPSHAMSNAGSPHLKPAATIAASNAIQLAAPATPLTPVRNSDSTSVREGEYIGRTAPPQLSQPIAAPQRVGMIVAKNMTIVGSLKTKELVTPVYYRGANAHNMAPFLQRLNTTTPGTIPASQTPVLAADTLTINNDVEHSSVMTNIAIEDTSSPQPRAFQP